jgi:hypothetical protein
VSRPRWDKNVKKEAVLAEIRSATSADLRILENLSHSTEPLQTLILSGSMVDIKNAENKHKFFQLITSILKNHPEIVDIRLKYMLFPQEDLESLCDILSTATTLKSIQLTHVLFPTPRDIIQFIEKIISKNNTIKMDLENFLSDSDCADMMHDLQTDNLSEDIASLLTLKMQLGENLYLGNLDATLDMLINTEEDDLTFTVHFADEEKNHATSAVMGQDASEKKDTADTVLEHAAPSAHKNKKDIPPSREAMRIIQACENYMVYLSKHAIIPIYQTTQKNTVSFHYANKTFHIEKILEEATKETSAAYALRLQNSRFDTAVMRYKIIMVCHEIMMDAPNAEKIKLFKKTYQQFKKEFFSTKDHPVDHLANATFLQSIGEKVAPLARKMTGLNKPETTEKADKSVAKNTPNKKPFR